MRVIALLLVLLASMVGAENLRASVAASEAAQSVGRQLTESDETMGPLSVGPSAVNNIAALPKECRGEPKRSLVALLLLLLLPAFGGPGPAWIYLGWHLEGSLMVVIPFILCCCVCCSYCRAATTQTPDNKDNIELQLTCCKLITNCGYCLLAVAYAVCLIFALVRVVEGNAVAKVGDHFCPLVGF